MFQTRFYSRFFDLNTEEFLAKIQQALNPLNKESCAAGHDDDSTTELYGFLWITATLIFLMFVSSTGSNLIADFWNPKEDGKSYQYDFTILTLSATLFYGYAVVVPAALFAVTLWVLKFQDRLSLTRLVSIYSYANVLWFPVTIANFVCVAVITSKFWLGTIEWCMVFLTGAISGFSIVWKVRPVILKNLLTLSADDVDAAHRKLNSLVLALVLAHAGFTVAVKFLFFGVKSGN